MAEPVLLLWFHGSPEQSNVNRRWVDAAAASSAVQIHYPGGEFDVREEQRLCEAANQIVFQHPMNWYGAPWTMKYWIDTVLTPGWAYGEGRVLSGKVWAEAVTVGAAREEYRPAGSRRYRAEVFFRSHERTAAFCGMRWVKPFIRYGAGFADHVTQDRWAAEYVAWLQSLKKM